MMIISYGFFVRDDTSYVTIWVIWIIVRDDTSIERSRRVVWVITKANEGQDITMRNAKGSGRDGVSRCSQREDPPPIKWERAR